MNTNCLRCGVPCRTGAPDPTKRAIVQAAVAGFCPNCMITQFLLGIEGIKTLIDGNDRHKGRGPEIFLNTGWREKVLRPVMAGVLAHTQMPEDAINWIEVVANWGLPWPKGHQPKEA